MIPTRSLLIIDPAIRTPSRAAHEELARRAGAVRIETVCPALEGCGKLRALDPQNLLGIIILGSAASVNDAAVWLDELKDWLRPVALAGATPVLGICFGHQLLAHVLGGRVARLFPQAIKGIRTITLATEALPWWPARPATVSLFHSHGEAVVAVPPTAQVLAESEILLPSGETATLVEALAYDGLPVWSFQPHPEATEAFVHEQQCAAMLETPELAVCFRDGWDIVTAFVQACLPGGPDSAASNVAGLPETCA